MTEPETETERPERERPEPPDPAPEPETEPAHEGPSGPRAPEDRGSVTCRICGDNPAAVCNRHRIGADR